MTYFPYLTTNFRGYLDVTLDKLKEKIKANFKEIQQSKNKKTPLTNSSKDAKGNAAL